MSYSYWLHLLGRSADGLEQEQHVDEQELAAMNSRVPHHLPAVFQLSGAAEVRQSVTEVPSRAKIKPMLRG